MSVFESFIEELKEENLLEDIVVSKSSKNDSDEAGQEPADKTAEPDSRPTHHGDRNAETIEPVKSASTESADPDAVEEPKSSDNSAIQPQSDDSKDVPLPGVENESRFEETDKREVVGPHNDGRNELIEPEPQAHPDGDRGLDETEQDMEAEFARDRRFEVIEPEHRLPADTDRRFEVIEHEPPADNSEDPLSNEIEPELPANNFEDPLSNEIGPEPPANIFEDRRFDEIEPEPPVNNYIDRRFDEIESEPPIRYINDRRFEVIEPEPPNYLDNDRQLNASELEKQPVVENIEHSKTVESAQDWTIDDEMRAEAIEPEQETTLVNEPEVGDSASRNELAEGHADSPVDYVSSSKNSDNGTEIVDQDPSQAAIQDQSVSMQSRSEGPLRKNVVNSEVPSDNAQPKTPGALSISDLDSEGELKQVQSDSGDLERSETIEAEAFSEIERTAEGENAHIKEMAIPDEIRANDDAIIERADSVSDLEEEIAAEAFDVEEGGGDQIDVETPSTHDKRVDFPDRTAPGASEKELYSQRIVDEVASLQVVEHVLDGIVRQQKRSVPRTYDVVPVKQALHKFLNEFKQLETVEQTASESNLRKEIESWHAALLNRDDALPTEYLRRYCEDNSMNSKSLVALARFYRNSHFSETVRSKFDLVVTRLFSRDAGNHKREMVLGRDELIESLNELYADWSSIPVYSDDDEDSELVLSAFKFEDFINEAKKCNNFDLLISSRFFKRIKTFKKNTNENFFAPLLVASAIECNVAVGNQYVDLIEKEKKKSGAKRISDQYGRIHDSSISDATSKTLQLVELLKERKPSNNPHITTDSSGSPADSTASNSPETGNEKKFGNDRKGMVFGIMALLGLIVCGYFLYSAFYGGNTELTASEKQVKLERSFLHEFVKTATIKDETFSGEVTENWDDLTTARKKEIVGKIFSVGSVKGFTRVELRDESGRVVGATVGTEVQITEIP